MPAKIQKKLRRKTSFSKKIISIFVVIFVLSLSWLGYRSMMVPTDINLVSTTDKSEFMRTDLSTEKRGTEQVAPQGCYYKQVQCVQAPCPMQLECDPSISTPSPKEMCTQEIGVCVGIDNTCVKYTDGCLKNRLCAKDQSSVANCRIATPPPQPSIPPNCTTWSDGCNTCSVIDGKIAGCTKMACKTFTEAKPQCLVYNTGVSPTPKPSVVATPKTSTLFSDFVASKPCGEAHFSSYRYSCHSGYYMADEGLCISFTQALATARTKCLGI